MKKLFFTLCALCLCGTMWGLNGNPSYWTDSNRPTDETQIYVDEATGLYFYVGSDGNAVITWSDASESNYENLTTLTIPATVTYENVSYNLTEVGPWAFYLSPIIGVEGTLTIPATLLYLNECSFAVCEGITQVDIEYSETVLTDKNTVTYDSSFADCTKITWVNLDRNVSSSSNNSAVATFTYVGGIKTVYIGEHVTSIPNYMFRSDNANHGGLTLSVVVSDAPSVPGIGAATFANLASGCTFYTKADYLNDYKADSYWVDSFGKDNMHAYDGDDPDEPKDDLAFFYDGLWYDPIFAEDGVTETGEAQIIASQDDTVYSGTLNIPATVENEGKTYNVTRVDASAFDGSSISGHLVIPSYITNLGTAAFRNCTELTEVTLEYSKTPIYDECPDSNSADECFIGCSKLATVNLYRDVTLAGGDNIIDGSFAYHTAISTVNIGPRVTEIPHHMFNTNSNSYSLTTINCYAINPPALGTAAFRAQYLNNGFVVNVPFGAEEAYLSDDDWTNMFVYENSGYTLAGHIAEMDDAFAITTHANDEGTAYATFYNSASNVELFNGTLTAYEATTLEDEGLVIDIVEIGNIIPKATGVVVETQTEGTYLAIATTEEEGSASENNHLYGYDSAQTITNPGDGYLYYLLSSYDGQVGFYWGAQNGAAFQCQAHRAYLALLSTAVTNANRISIRKGNGGEDTTGISSVENTVEGASVKGIYTIQGVRVSNMNQPGLYIVDGKKVLVK